MLFSSPLTNRWYAHMTVFRNTLLTVVICTLSVAPSYARDANNYDYAHYDDCNEIADPFEKLNRKIFMFNSVLDHFILRPIAKGYKAILNDYTRDRVSSFVNNIAVPLTTVNNALQLNPDGVLLSFWKFVINTTLGVGGIYDVAGKFGLNVQPQTFGNTLAHYGVRPGPYVVLPFFGGTNVRDIFDMPLMNNALNPIKYKIHDDFLLGLTAVSFVQKRSEILELTDYITKNSVDPYASVRSILSQKRESEVQYPKSTSRCNKEAF